MNLTEAYIPWIPLPNVNGEFELCSVLDDEDGLHLTLSNDTGRRLRVDFRSALAYRLTGRAVFPPSGLAGERELEAIFRGLNGPFFTVRDSAWVGQIKTGASIGASGEINELVQSLAHYFFVLEGELIEVLSDEEPNIAWLNTLFGDAI